MDDWLLTAFQSGAEASAIRTGSRQTSASVCVWAFVCLQLLPAGRLPPKPVIVPVLITAGKRFATSARLHPLRRKAAQQLPTEVQTPPPAKKRELTGWLNEGSMAVVMQRPS